MYIFTELKILSVIAARACFFGCSLLSDSAVALLASTESVELLFSAVLSSLFDEDDGADVAADGFVEEATVSFCSVEFVVDSVVPCA
ncbi:hypothetical protein ABQE25_10230 [Enterococcus avium]